MRQITHLLSTGLTIGRLTNVSGQGAPSVHSVARRLRRLGWVGALLVALLALAPVLGQTLTIYAANEPAVQTFFVPLPEDQVRTSFLQIYSGTGATMHGVIGVSITVNNTIIYYDQWENGYDTDIANPTNLYSAGNLGGTQIWGDGNTANGAPPGVPSDILNAGTVISLENDIAIPRNPATILFDGRDKLSSSKVVAVTKSAWALTPGTVLADAIEVNDTTRWGSSFKMPIGQDLSSSSMFEYTSLLVMASENGTVVQIDTDGNGTVDLTQTLSQGQSYQVNGGIKSNATVTSSKPIQVDLITGDIGSTYENRWFSIPPTIQWGSSYYTPVGTTSTSYPANVWLYNPNASAITVNYETKIGTGTVNVAAGATARFEMPSLSGAHFFTTNSAVFAALGTMDSSVSGADQTFDWGYTLVPESYLTSAFAVGWAPGTSDLSGNGSPVWVTAVKPTTIYVDYDGDPSTGSLTDSRGKKYNVAFTLTALESKQIYDPDKNQTGMRVYTLDGTLITGAWGEDPSKAQAGNPYMDVGYTIPPLPQVVLEKTGHVANDSNSNGELDPGETLGYTITAKNLGVATFFNTIISDTVPTNVTYVPNSTKFNGTPVADNTGPATAFPLDEGGLNVGNILVGGSIKVTFEALANAFPPVYSSIGNTATAYVGGEAFLIKVNTPVNTGTITQCTIDFTNSGGTAATIYLENGTVYVQVNDADQNANTSAAETVSVNLVNSNTSDVEALTLTETGVNTGIFRGNMPSSITAGQTSGDGTLYAKAGDSVAATYTDPIFGDTCSDSVSFSLPSQTKVLYLSDPSQALDRIDPVATGDSSTASTSVLGSSSTASITVVGSAASSNTTQTASSHTFSYDSGSTGSNRILMVGVSYRNNDSETVSSVTYNGQTMTSVGTDQIASGTPDGRVYIFYLLNPPTGSHNLVVTWSSALNQGGVVGAVTYAGVDQTTPLGAFNSASGTSATPGATIVSAANELVFGVVGGRTTSDFTVTGGGTSLWSARPFSGQTAGAGQSRTGASPNVALGWSGTNTTWVAGGVSLKPATTTGTASTTFTQTLSMASNLAMPVGGMITVTNYISVTSGTPVAPVEITATLKYGSNTFATLTTPTMTSLGSGIYKLVWTGVLASNTTVPTGQQIFLTLKTSEPGVAFKFFYDSATYPSRVQLTTTTVIDVTSLGLYDAPYPGGTLLTGAANGQTVYVRAAVSDPFGASDITTSTVTLTDPNNTPSTVTLSGGNLVASTTGSKTFEYVWNTSVVQGIYNVQVTSHEGYEAITDSASTPFNLSYQDTGTPSTSEFTTGSNGPVASLYSPNSSICVRVTDVDQNANPGLAETITATISSASGDSETVTLTETGLDTGVFVACIPSSNSIAGSSGNGTLYAPAGSVLAVRYVDPNDASDVSGATATISTPTPALSLSKVQVEPADGIAVIGDRVRFDIAIVNPGPTPLLTVALTDTFPASCLSYQSASITPSSAVTPTISWSNVGPIASGASKTISLYFQATAACSPATNSVVASGVDNDSAHVSAGPATADVTTTRPGLSVTKTLVTPASGSPEIGDPVVFHIALANTGSTAIANLPLSDNYSSGCLAYVSADPPATAAGGGAVLWSNLGPLPTSQSTTVDVTFEVVGACDPTENVADVSAATDANGDAVPAAQGSASLTTVSASIGDLVWDDSDGNGVQAVGELGLPGVVLSLTLPGGAVITTTTDVSGTYNFASLVSGNYTVIVNTDTLPANYFLTTSNQPLLVTLAAGQVMTTADFGYQAGGAVTGHIFEDTNGNGTQDGTEPGLQTITVVITDSLGLTHTVTTDANGDYTATVPAGLTTADVDETTLPAGYVHTAGEDPNEATVPSGGSISAGDNGYQPQGDVTGHVFEDTDGNGTQDGVEPDLPSVTVVITDSLGVTHTVSTDANGNYTATVPAGSTTADVDETTLPAGYVQTAGADPNTVTALTGNTISIGNDGYQPQGDVIGHVFEDTDGNGIQGKSEPDLPSITVVITDSLGVTHTVSTDANGNYTATVPAGLTTADVDETTLPAGYVQTAGDDPSTVTATAGNTTSIGIDG
ncbi:MAG: hypothetical protein NT075_28620, partial [Chloroflexi bacterium]|nr:hypothetical protein [Chloroflexota bacterium]